MHTVANQLGRIKCKDQLNWKSCRVFKIPNTFGPHVGQHKPAADTPHAIVRSGTRPVDAPVAMPAVGQQVRRDAESGPDPCWVSRVAFELSQNLFYRCSSLRPWSWIFPTLTWWMQHYLTHKQLLLSDPTEILVLLTGTNPIKWICVHLIQTSNEYRFQLYHDLAFICGVCVCVNETASNFPCLCLHHKFHMLPYHQLTPTCFHSVLLISGSGSDRLAAFF